MLDVVCRITKMRFAAVARVTEDRWIACSVRDGIEFGLMAGSELKLETTICNEVRREHAAVVIDHVAADLEYRDHHTPAMYGFQSYISMPIVLPDGRFFGTLCAIDPAPARLKSPEIIGMFKIFAELIAFHLHSQQQLALSEASLSSERRTAELREQFIAVLGHDLRNPLASIDAGARMLIKTPLNERAAGIVALMQNSVRRMAGLIDNVLDFARGRLGGGLALRRDANEPLQQTLEHVLDELKSAWPTRVIDYSLAIEQPVSCDRLRIGQLASNLVSNALSHGATDTPVRVEASTPAGFFQLSVTNSGKAIPPAVLQKLFEPFVRATAQPNDEGLGLGLYIASEIARAHDGTLSATSTDTATTFTFRMPLG